MPSGLAMNLTIRTLEKPATSVYKQNGVRCLAQLEIADVELRRC